MNAYELADIVDKWAYKESAEYLTDAANMLRHQADRIAELSKNVDELEEELLKTPQIKELSDRELVVFLMDEIDRASEWLVDGETHMAIGVLGQCHAKIRKHLNNTKES